MSDAPQILIAGIGNMFFGDDGFGCEVARRLSERTLPEGVRVFDFGIRGLDLAYALAAERDLTVLVDAMSRRQSPGTLYVIEPQLDDPNCQCSPDAHSLNPETVMRFARTLGASLENILLVACEPTPLDDQFDIQAGLSEPVLKAVDEAVELIESIVRRRLKKHPSEAAYAHVAELVDVPDPATVHKE